MSNSSLIFYPISQTADLEDVPRSLRGACDSSPEKRRQDCSSTTASIDWARSSPTRSPTWRWEFARQIVEAGRRGPRSSVESWLLEAVRYRREASRSCSPEKLSARYPAVHAAQSIHHHEHARRSLLEAWILSGSDDAQIASESEASPEVIEAYEQLFFNVRDRLGASDFILWAIRHVHGTAPHPRAEVVQRLAYFGGPTCLRAVLDAVGIPVGLLGESAWPAVDLGTAAGRNQARIQLLIDLETLDLSELTPKELCRLREIGRRSAAATSSVRTYRAGWDVVLDKLPIKATAEEGMIRAFERSSAAIGVDLVAELSAIAA
ncbi:MAG: hypothetical protein RIC12_00095 [Pirellulales bacterium]